MKFDFCRCFGDLHGIFFRTAYHLASLTALYGDKCLSVKLFLWTELKYIDALLIYKTKISSRV